MKRALQILGELIRERRLERGLTQGEVGGKELSTAYISQVERGNIRPSGSALRYLAERLELPLREMEELTSSDHDLLVAEYHLRRAKLYVKGKDIQHAMQELTSFEQSLTSIDDGTDKIMLQALALEQRALLQRTQGEHAAAQESLKEAQSLYESLRHAAGVLRCLVQTADIMWTTGRHLPAIEQLQAVIPDLDGLSELEPQLKWQVFHLLGVSLLDTGEAERAKEYLQLAMSLAEDMVSPAGYAYALLDSTSQLEDVRKLRLVVEALERAYVAWGRSEWLLDMGWNLHELGKAHLRLRQMAKAEDCFARAAEIAETADSLRLKVTVSLERAQAGLLFSGYFADPQRICEEVLQLTKGHADELGYEVALAHMFLTSAAMSHDTDTEQRLLAAIDALKHCQLTSKVRTLFITIYHRLANVADIQGDTARALEYYRKASQLSDDVKQLS